MPEASSRWWTPAVLALALLRPEGASALAAFRRPHAFGAARAAYAGGGIPASAPCYRSPLLRHRQRRRHQPPLFATAAANEGDFGEEEAEEDENVDYPSFRRRDDDPNAEYPSFRVERYLALTLSRSAQSARYGSSGGDGGGDGERGGERSGTTELIDSEQQDEEPYEEPSFRSDSYLGSLSRYADDGRSLLKAPQRYSSRQWRDNLASMSGDKVLRAVRGQLLWQCVWALFISLVYIIAGRLWAGAWGRGLPALPALPHSLLGGVLGVLLGFRTNQSYERFWEGRKLWGQCFAICRTLARSSLVYIDADTDTYARIIRNLKAFPVALSSTCAASSRWPSSRGRWRRRRSTSSRRRTTCRSPSAPPSPSRSTRSSSTRRSPRTTCSGGRSRITSRSSPPSSPTASASCARRCRWRTRCTRRASSRSGWAPSRLSSSAASPACDASSPSR